MAPRRKPDAVDALDSTPPANDDAPGYGSGTSDQDTVDQTQHTLDQDGLDTEKDTNDDDATVPAPYPTNFGGDLGDIAGVVVHNTDPDADLPNESAVISEVGEVSMLGSPLNNRDFIDPTADNRHPNPVPRQPAHVFEDGSPDKPDDYEEPNPLGMNLVEKKDSDLDEPKTETLV